MHYPVPSHTCYGAMKGQKSSITPVSFYPVMGQTDNCVRTVSYKPFPAQNRSHPPFITNYIKGRKTNEKNFFLFITLVALLAGCAKKQGETDCVENPYEIIKEKTIISYYNTKDELSTNDFNVIENNVQNFQDINNNIIVNEEGIIRCITIIDSSIITYPSISVGDSIETIENSFNNEYRIDNNYMVIFNKNIEENPQNQNKGEDWIWLNYVTDGSVIKSIQIYDVRYGTQLI